ncbi:sensor histidine kinase [Oceanicaulis sp. MMSF_3324]|uniref:sensor histidine kinase n=1 Tax=Oceanicaulis sp. MMSF_3324 TaxID=3046702 RepID=UPI00273E41D9|nr:sensor histidine kinase [Oceanicaulis sp. MMSF_3324]
MASDPLYKPDSPADDTGAETTAPSRAQRLRGLSETPAFYLIYLVFYFTPWFFQLPGMRDALISFAAVGSFIPVYLYANAGDPYREGVKPRRVLMATAYASFLSLALIPVVGMSGNFHIFAVTLLAGLRPQKLALLAMAGLSAFYMVASWLLDVTLFELVLSQFIAVMAGMATLAGYESAQRVTVRERNLRMEAELAALRERERIAQDLHDLLGHTLTTIAVKSELAARLLDADADRARSEIIEIRDAARITLKDVRAAVAGMHVTTVHQELSRARSALSAADIRLVVEGEPPELDQAAHAALGLALREAITNIIRHSGAETAHIRFAPEGALIIEDDGQGGALNAGTGLMGMRRRIESLGGEMQIESRDSGVRVTLSLPPTQPGQERLETPS